MNIAFHIDRTARLDSGKRLVFLGECMYVEILEHQPKCAYSGILSTIRTQNEQAGSGKTHMGG